MTEIRFYRASGEFGFLSNLYRSELFFEGRFFPHSEAAYQFAKPKDPKVAEWIVAAPKPHLCAAIAHSLLAFDIRPEWNDIKVARMRNVVHAKFIQSSTLKKKLLDTGDAVLIEDSKTDAFWGVGKKGDGKNMLGGILMEVREIIRKDTGAVQDAS